MMKLNKQRAGVCEEGVSHHTNVSGWFPFFWLFSPQKLKPIHPATDLWRGGNWLLGGRDPLPAASPVAEPGAGGWGYGFGDTPKPQPPQRWIRPPALGCKPGASPVTGSGAMVLGRILCSVPAVSPSAA